MFHASPRPHPSPTHHPFGRRSNFSIDSLDGVEKQRRKSLDQHHNYPNQQAKANSPHEDTTQGDAASHVPAAHHPEKESASTAPPHSGGGSVSPVLGGRGRLSLIRFEAPKSPSNAIHRLKSIRSGASQIFSFAGGNNSSGSGATTDTAFSSRPPSIGSANASQNNSKPSRMDEPAAVVLPPPTGPDMVPSLSADAAEPIREVKVVRRGYVPPRAEDCAQPKPLTSCAWDPNLNNSSLPVTPTGSHTQTSIVAPSHVSTPSLQEWPSLTIQNKFATPSLSRPSSHLDDHQNSALIDLASLPPLCASSAHDLFAISTSANSQHHTSILTFSRSVSRQGSSRSNNPAYISRVSSLGDASSMPACHTSPLLGPSKLGLSPKLAPLAEADAPRDEDKTGFDLTTGTISHDSNTSSDTQPLPSADSATADSATAESAASAPTSPAPGLQRRVSFRDDLTRRISYEYVNRVPLHYSSTSVSSHSSSYSGSRLKKKKLKRGSKMMVEILVPRRRPSFSEQNTVNNSVSTTVPNSNLSTSSFSLPMPSTTHNGSLTRPGSPPQSPVLKSAMKQPSIVPALMGEQALTPGEQALSSSSSSSSISSSRPSPAAQLHQQLSSFRSAQSLADRCAHWTRQGGVLLKFSSSGKPQKRWVYVEENENEIKLCWNEASKKQIQLSAQGLDFFDDEYEPSLEIVASTKPNILKRILPTFQLGKWKFNAQRHRSLLDVVGIHYGCFYSSHRFQRVINRIEKYHTQLAAKRGLVARYTDDGDDDGVAAVKPWLCFSLQFPDRTLDFAAPDVTTLTRWFMGLQAQTPQSVFHMRRGMLLWQRAIMKLNYYGLDPLR